MNYIKSKDNNLIKDIRKLNERKYREQKNQFLVEGFRFILEALQSDFCVPLIFVSENQKDRWRRFEINSNLQKNTKVYWVSKEVFKSLSSTENPQGIIAVVNNKSIEIEYKNGFYILIDRIQDPGNLGTIIRSADASNALGVILIKGTVDAYNQKTLRATMGSIFHVPIISNVNYNVVNELKEDGFKLIVSSLDTKNNFYDINLMNKSIIAVGNEGQGVSDELFELADYKVKIPMPGRAESLNASVAASIMMFEIVRQNNLTKLS